MRSIPRRRTTPIDRPRRGAIVATLLMALATACGQSIAPAYHGAVSDHFDGKHFFNYERTPEHQLEDAIRRSEPGRHRGHWDKWQDTPTDTPPGRVVGSELRITFVNHSTVLIQTAGLNILCDPVWSSRVSPLAWYGPKRHRPPGIRFEDLPPIDLVLISHNHYDHMDLPTLRRLTQTFHPRIIVGLGNTAFLEKNGVPGSEDIDWWQTVGIAPGVRLTGVPARHWSARSVNDVDRTLWLGFVLETPAGRVYFAGDTGFGQFFTLIHERFPSFRLAFLPIAPARPRSAMAPRHMSAGDAVRAAELLHAETSVAIHFGTFQQGDDSQSQPVDSLTSALAAHPNLEFLALRNGEARWIGVVPCGLTAGSCTRPAGVDLLLNQPPRRARSMGAQSAFRGCRGEAPPAVGLCVLALGSPGREVIHDSLPDSCNQHMRNWRFDYPCVPAPLARGAGSTRPHDASLLTASDCGRLRYGPQHDLLLPRYGDGERIHDPRRFGPGHLEPVGV